MAWVGLTFWFQPEIVPSSVTKMNVLGADAIPWLTTKSFVVLFTVPVGADGGLCPAGGGIVTMSGAPGGNGWPVASYRVETPVTLLATQNAPVAGLTATPHGLIRFGSTR